MIGGLLICEIKFKTLLNQKFKKNIKNVKIKEENIEK